MPEETGRALARRKHSLRPWTLDIYSNKSSVHNIGETGTTSISKINNQTRIIPGIYVPSAENIIEDAVLRKSVLAIRSEVIRVSCLQDRSRGLERELIMISVFV